MREPPKLIRRGRPAGAVTRVVTRVVIDTLASEPLSRRQLAARLGLSYTDADNAIDRLRQRGAVAAVGCEWPRPARGSAGSLYAPAPAEQRTADLQAVWLRVIST
jgi:hypothetical protein